MKIDISNEIELLSYHFYCFSFLQEPIRNMMLYYGDVANIPKFKQYLIAVSERSVVRVPLAQCNRFNTCTDCVALRDPHCAWNLEIKKCEMLNVDNFSGYVFQLL